MPVGDGILDIHFHQITTYSVRAEYRGPVLIGGKVVDHKGIGLLRIRIEDMGSKGIVYILLPLPARRHRGTAESAADTFPSLMRIVS